MGEVLRLQDIIDEEIAELQEAVAKVQDETEGNSISIVDVKRKTDENRNSIMNVNLTLDYSVEEFSKSLKETEKRLSDDISGVDFRVDILVNAATMKCSYDSDCDGDAFCYAGWCNLLPECYSNSDCEGSSDCYQGFCYDYRSNTFVTGSNLNTFDSLNDAITYCNSHSDCTGIYDNRCDGFSYYAMHGPPHSSSIGSCSWVKT